jgi:dual specificity phosphatase 12
MSYLLHGSTAHTGMGWVDLVPRAGKLYIGGLYALYQTDLIEAAGITHVLSVIDYDIGALLREKLTFGGLKRYHIRAEDHPNENLLQYFEKAVWYIDQALDSVNRNSRAPLEDPRTSKGGAEERYYISDLPSKTDRPTLPNDSKAPGQEQRKSGGVFIHCAMGKSRSATLVCAYLMWKYYISLEAALEQLCEGRAVCEPNVGFREQLEVWAKMCTASGKQEKKNIYEEWEKNRFTGEVWEWEKRVRNKKKDEKREVEEEGMKARL